MKPRGAADTKWLATMYRFEFYTLHRGRLVRKEAAEREWYAAEGRGYGPLERLWAEERLKSLHGEFAAARRRPRWVSFHPELLPALVGSIASGRQVVIQARAHFETEPYFPTTH